MLRELTHLSVLTVGLLAGCGQAPPAPSIAAAPHGGNMIHLSDSVGSVEIVSDIERSARGSRKATAKSRIFAYFYQPDGTPGLSAPPSEIKMTLGDGTSIAFAPDPAEAGKFASSPGNYPDSLRGKIELQHDGKPVEASFSFR